MQFENSIAIVTGGASGMGEATARALAKRGAKVAILDMNYSKAQTVASAIDGIAFECNVSDANSAEQVFTEIKKLGDLRICVNCAGIAPGKRVVGRDGVMPLDDFAKVININLIGTFNILRLAAETMVASVACNEDGERGVIINTASIAAYEGQIGQAAYSASKGGVVAMTLPIARELARFGVRVMTIAPGIMATPMMQAMPEKVQASLAQMMPFPKRLGSADEYAKLALHIIENAYLNGEVIRLDAAIRMQEK